MTEYLRITGLNNIQFDQCLAAGDYCIPDGDAPRGMSIPLAREDVLRRLEELPICVRGHALNRGLSIVQITVTIRGETDAAMEANQHNLTETLEDAMLFICSAGERGTQAVLESKTDGASATSYKTIYWGKLDEALARAILSSRIKEHELANCQLTLYCEPHWRPSTKVTLGPNEIYCPSFEEDGDANGRADDWAALNVPVLTMETTIVLHGCDSQQVTTNLVGEGIASTTMVAPAAPANDAVAYAWVCRVGAGTDIRAVLRDTTAGVDRATADYSAATTTATGKSGQTWYRLELIATNTIVPANNHQLWIYSLSDTVTDWYVDKCFWKWDTTTIPDEWCDHWLMYNHYDTTEGAAHEGHINYFDVDDLKGDVDCRGLMRVEYREVADEEYARHLIVARRTRSRACCWDFWIEAEDDDAASNWSDQALARCSAGGCKTNSAATTGLVYWLYDHLFTPTADTMHGDYDVYGAVYTDDPDHTWYRTFTGHSVSNFFFGPWVRQTLTSKWELIKLGEYHIDPFIRSGVQTNVFYLGVQYQKDAADTVKLDFVWLIPRDEPHQRLESIAGRTELDVLEDNYLYEDEFWVQANDEDFDYVGHEEVDPAEDWWRPLWRKGPFMSLAPNIENRLYFVCETYDSPDDIYEAHGVSTDLQLALQIHYLPQYISPME